MTTTTNDLLAAIAVTAWHARDVHGRDEVRKVDRMVANNIETMLTERGWLDDFPEETPSESTALDAIIAAVHAARDTDGTKPVRQVEIRTAEQILEELRQHFRLITTD